PIRWNPDIQDYELDQLTYEPWEGYWVYNPLNTIINLDVNPNIVLGKKQSSELFSAMKDDEFLVQVQAFMKSSQAVDKQNYVAMVEGASDGLDRFDVIKPPSVTGQINLSIASGKNYNARDAVPVSKDGAFWDFKVETKSPNELFNLAVNRISSLPENFGIWVLDTDREIPLDINSGSAEIVTRENARSNFRIIVGTEEFAKIHSENISLTPYEYTLYQNYPNPFNPSTTITYQLREKSEVSLEIFDILGRRIQTIVNNITQNPGQHSITWYGLNTSGEKVASGVYIYRIKANNFISTKKMILLK
ncbi:MAG TPA: T9SS type A sorting domain-containing protein, partial [Ignavibacteriaceae bacterium]